MAFDIGAMLDTINKIMPLINMYQSGQQRDKDNTYRQRQFDEQKALNRANIASTLARTKALQEQSGRQASEYENLTKGRQAMGEYGQMIGSPEAIDYYADPNKRKEINQYDKMPIPDTTNLPQDDIQAIQKPASKVYNIPQQMIGTENQLDLFRKLGNLQFGDLDVAKQGMSPIVKDIQDKAYRDWQSKEAELGRDERTERARMSQKFTKEYLREKINPATGMSYGDSDRLYDITNKIQKDPIIKDVNESMQSFNVATEILGNEKDARKLAFNTIKQMATKMLQGNRMTDKDVELNSGVQNITGKIKQFIKAKSESEITEENKKAFLNYFNVLKDANTMHARKVLENKKKVYTTGLQDDSLLSKNINSLLDNITERYNSPVEDAGQKNNATIDFTKGSFQDFQDIFDEVENEEKESKTWR